MTRIIRYPSLVVFVLALAGGTSSAQFDINGPNAVMTLQDTVPSVADPVDHDVSVPTPGLFEMKIVTNANPGVPLLLAYTPVSPSTGSIFLTPWGGSIDIGTFTPSGPGNLILVGDGIGLSVGPLDFFFGSDQGSALLGTAPSFVLTLAAGSALAGANAAFQSIVSDPTMPPLNLDNTEAVDANFVAGQTSILNIGSSNPAQVPFLPGKSFNFHGVSYTEVHVNVNGFINFVNASTIPSNGFTVDTAAWVTSEPSIAAYINDFENYTAPDGVLYEEIGNQIRIAWGDPLADPSGIRHFFGNDSNTFEIRLELQDTAQSNPLDGQFEIDLINIDPSATQQLGDGVLGHTPGTGLFGGSADVDLHTAQAVGPQTAQFEEHNATGGNATVLGWDGLGSARAYNNYDSWNGQTLSFVPGPFVTTAGDGGYSSSSSGAAPDDVTAVSPSGLAVAGGQNVTIAGKFAGFNDAAGFGGSVTFDPGGAALPGIVVGILDGTNTLIPSLPNNPSTGPYRNGEGLVIVTPTFAGTGTVTMQVDFNNGASFQIQVNIVNSNQIFTSYSLLSSNPVTATHLLTNTIDFYGVTYTSINLALHGYLTFAVPSNDFSETMTEFFAGWQTSPSAMPNPGVALMWSDLNLNNPTATFDVIEDIAANSTQIAYRNQIYWDSGSPAGDATVTFNSAGPNSLTFDYTAFIADANPAANPHDVIIGFTDGDSTMGLDTDLSDGMATGFAGAVGTYLSASGGDSVGELLPVGVQPPLGIFNAIDTGNGMGVPFGTWTIF